MKKLTSLPSELVTIGRVLADAGFDAYIVGGCVRDLLLSYVPADWDITTNARPEDILRLFPENSFYENNFGTVTVVTESNNESLKHIEITPYRTETSYSDRRHPDSISFADTLREDLKRRDFTVNAMAIDIRVLSEKNKDDVWSIIENVIDYYDGKKDLEEKILRTVGYAEERFAEDALRMVRAARLATALDFDIDIKTAEAIKKHCGLLTHVSMERIRDELTKLMNTATPARGLEIMRELGILPFVMPELLEGYDVGQNLHHIYTVWEHNLRALTHATEEGWPLHVRMAALLHDVAKPRTKHGEGKYSTFYGHDVVGARMTKKMLTHLVYSSEFVDKVTKLVRYHLFYYNVDEVTESSVRRLIMKVGADDMEDLIRVRICDRIGSGVPKAEPYKLRHFRFLVEKLSRDPISVGMLKLRGDDVMRITGMAPGPRVGFLLKILLEDVLDDPAFNTNTYLEKRVQELHDMSDAELQKLADTAKKKAEIVEEGEVGDIKKKHWVK